MFNYRHNCRPCNNQSLVYTQYTNTQKNILKQNQVSSSLYVQERTSLEYFDRIKDSERFEATPYINESVKHNSYQRYMNKKRGDIIRRNSEKFKSNKSNMINEYDEPKTGNKYQPFTITRYALKNEKIL